MKHMNGLFLLAIAATCSYVRAEPSDEKLAKDYLQCAAISDFIISAIDGTTPQAAEAKIGWEQKRRAFIGSARLLTSQEFTKSQLILANEKFILDFSEHRAAEKGDSKTVLRQLLNSIDDCEKSVEENKTRLLELAKRQKPS